MGLRGDPCRKWGNMSAYVQWGIFLITTPNLIIIVLMILVFVAALFMALPRNQETDGGAP
jgi:hypothetical protein